MILKADWLADPFIRQIVEILGAENIRFVGGAVRDEILGRPVTDIDAATSLLPDDVMNRLKAAGVRVVPTGQVHGTVTAVGEARTVEITTLRRDETTDGRHAEVAFTDSWLEDAARRDFTMNALYVDISGTLYDPLGGIEDAQNRRLRFIGNAAERIKEDTLRILRYFRFHATLGIHDYDEGLKACEEARELLAGLSAERVRDELMKIFACDHVQDVVRHMGQAGIWEVLGLPVSLDRIDSIESFEKGFGQKARPSVRLFAALEPTPDPSAFARRLKLPGVIRKLLQAIEAIMKNDRPTQPQDVRQIMYQYGQEATVQAGICQGWDKTLMDVATAWDIPLLPVQGRDIMETGVLPGAEVGERLKKVEAAWLASDFSLDRSELLKLI